MLNFHLSFILIDLCIFYFIFSISIHSEIIILKFLIQLIKLVSDEKYGNGSASIT